MRIRNTAAIGVLLVAVPLAAQQASPPSVSLLVSTAWLAEHLSDSGVVVLQTSQSPEAAEQIPGARVVPHGALMTMSAGHDLAATSDLVAALERAGVSNSSHVVVYGEPLAAGWLFFALDYLGHERTSLLDGGLEKWKAEGRPVSPATPAPAAGRFQPRVRLRVKSSADAIQNRGRGAVALLDARSEREYVEGHIPGARLLTWDQVYADAKLQIFKSRAEVAALFAAAGAPGGTSAITYCQIGLRSSLLYFAARYAGLDASNYVGSWSEWSAKGLPTEPAR
jgi:thiosulfate/3-mercaptopyruvate sulfurtransferase